MGRVQPVILGLTESIANLCHDQLQLFRTVVAVVERYRVEVVPELALMREEENTAVRKAYASLLRIFQHSFAQSFLRIAKMIALIIRRPIPMVESGKRRHCHQLRKPVNVEKRHEQRVSELVARRCESAMTNAPDIDRRFHIRRRLPNSHLAFQPHELRSSTRLRGNRKTNTLRKNEYGYAR